MSDIEPDTHAERRAQRREPRYAQRADPGLPERRPEPLARSRDPFDDSSLTIRERRLAGRRVDVDDRVPGMLSFVAPLDDDASIDPAIHRDFERDALIADLSAATSAFRPAPARRSARRQAFPWPLLAVCAASIVILYLVWFWGDADPSRLCFAPGCTARDQTLQMHTTAQSPSLPTPDGQHSVLGPPSISAQQIDRILAEWNSPAAGTGATWVELGARYGIDPAYALAFFIHESGAGTAPGWAGRKPDGSTTHNVGNIICAGYRTCYGRFRDYASWEEGIEDWYRLIAVEYVEWRGVHTVEEIVPIYAPAVENNVSAYIDAVNRLVAEWRAAHAR